MLKIHMVLHVWNMNPYIYPKNATRVHQTGANKRQTYIGSSRFNGDFAGTMVFWWFSGVWSASRNWCVANWSYLQIHGNIDGEWSNGGDVFSYRLLRFVCHRGRWLYPPCLLLNIPNHTQGWPTYISACWFGPWYPCSGHRLHQSLDPQPPKWFATRE